MGIGLLDTSAGETVRHIGADQRGTIAAFAVSDDGQILVTENHLPLRELGFMADLNQDTVHCWSFPGGKHLCRLRRVTQAWYQRGRGAGQMLDDLGCGSGGFRIRFLADHKHLVVPAYRKETFLSIATVDGTISLVELATGKALYSFPDFDLKDIRKFKVSPDGTRVAATVQMRAGKAYNLALVWDIAHLQQKSKRRATCLMAQELDACWNDLASKEVARAHRAMRALVNTPAQAVSLLQKHLRPVPPVSNLADLVARLDSPLYKTRHKATRKLESLGELSRPALENSIKAKPSIEVLLRIKILLAKLKRLPISLPELRVLRALDILEHIGDPKARALLQKMATAAPGAHPTEMAGAVLQRLKRQGR
jgi:hypothetical protein